MEDPPHTHTEENTGSKDTDPGRRTQTPDGGHRRFLLNLRSCSETEPEDRHPHRPTVSGAFAKIRRRVLIETIQTVQGSVLFSVDTRCRRHWR